MTWGTGDTWEDRAELAAKDRYGVTAPATPDDLVRQDLLVKVYVAGARWQRSRLRDEAAEEATAKAMFNAEIGPADWSKVGDAVQAEYHRRARTAITALLGELL